MKKSIVSFLAFQLLSTLASAQKPAKASITFGEEYKESKRMSMDEVMSFDDNGFIVRNSDFKTIRLDYFTSSMKRTLAVPVDLGQKGEKRGFEFGVDFNDRLLIFSSFTNKKQEKSYLFYQEFNKGNLKPDGELVKIAEINVVNSGGLFGGTYGSFANRMSRDKSKMLISGQGSSKKKAYEELNFVVVDDKLDILWEKSVTLPYTDDLFSIENMIIDNQGRVHVLGKLFEDKREAKQKEKQGEAPFTYMILSFYNNGEDMTEYTLEFSGKYARSMNIAMSAKEEIICAGYYSLPDDKYDVKGSFFLTVNPDKREVNSGDFNSFSFELFTEEMDEKSKEKAAKKEEKGKGNLGYKYDLREIILRTDGGAIVIGEQYYVIVRTYTDSKGNTTTTYVYHYNHILVTNVNPDGTIASNHLIPKLQFSSNDMGYYLSFVTHVLDDKIIFLFNDTVKNLKVKEGGKVETFRLGQKGTIAQVDLNADGSRTKKALTTSAPGSELLVAKKSEQVSKNDMVIYMQKGKTKRLAKINFEN